MVLNLWFRGHRPIYCATAASVWIWSIPARHAATYCETASNSIEKIGWRVLWTTNKPINCSRHYKCSDINTRPDQCKEIKDPTETGVSVMSCLDWTVEQESTISIVFHKLFPRKISAIYLYVETYATLFGSCPEILLLAKENWGNFPKLSHQVVANLRICP